MVPGTKILISFTSQTPAEPLILTANRLSSGYCKFNREQRMIEDNIVREFNWVDKDLLKDDQKVLGMSLYLTDTKEVDDLRRLLGRGSRPRLETWEFLIDKYLS